MKGSKKIANRAFAAKEWLPVALRTVRVDLKFRKLKDGLFRLSTELAKVERAELRDIAQQVAEDVHKRHPELDREKCFNAILKRLSTLQKKGQEAIVEFKKQIKKSGLKK